MKTIQIKGKDYIPVNERVKEFHAQYPNWTIKTRLLHFDENCAIVKAGILDENDRLRASGVAQEFRDSKGSLVNSTSYVENCETSAVGRALGFLGIGIDASIASADEVQRAIDQQAQSQQQPQLPRNPQLVEKALGMNTADEVLSYYKAHQAELDADPVSKKKVVDFGKQLRQKEAA